MSVETEEDLKNLQRVGKLVSQTIKLMLKNLEPGVTTGYIDQLAREYFESFGARSAPELDYGFPGATCISVNQEVAHGIPGTYVIKKGDMVNVDVSLELNGYYADAGYTTVVGNGDSTRTHLCNTSRMILNETINSIKAGDKINKIGYSIEKLARANGYRVIKNLAGHGIGRKLHEEPVDILNYGVKRDKRILESGLVIAVETFISSGSEYVIPESDGWTLRCHDRSPVAQFEHTIVITDTRPIILTD